MILQNVLSFRYKYNNNECIRLIYVTIFELLKILIWQYNVKSFFRNLIKILSKHLNCQRYTWRKFWVCHVLQNLPRFNPYLSCPCTILFTPNLHLPLDLQIPSCGTMALIIILVFTFFLYIELYPINL